MHPCSPETFNTANSVVSLIQITYLFRFTAKFDVVYIQVFDLPLT